MPRCLARPEHPSQKLVPPTHSHGAPSQCSPHHRPQSSPARKEKDCWLLFTDGDTTTPRHAGCAQGTQRGRRGAPQYYPSIRPSIRPYICPQPPTSQPAHFCRGQPGPEASPSPSFTPGTFARASQAYALPDLGLPVITGQGQALGTPSLGCPADYPKL